MMAFKLLAMAEERWRKVNGSELLPLVRAGVRFVDGIQEKRKSGAGERRRAPPNARARSTTFDNISGSRGSRFSEFGVLRC